MADPLDELAVVPPGEFVAARTRLVADLKAAGDTDAAARVAKLRRPSQLHWAINVTVREQPELAAAWFDAADAARAAGSAELRSSLTAVRGAAADLSRAVGTRASAGDAAQVLAHAASDPGLAAAVASGTLGFDVEDRSPPRRAKGRLTDRVGTRPAEKPTAASRKKTQQPDPNAKRAAAQAARERAQQALADARAASEAATRAHDAAEDDLEAAATELDEARQRAQHAERAHLAAQRRRAATERIAAEARDELERAERRLAAAQDNASASRRDP